MILVIISSSTNTCLKKKHWVLATIFCVNIIQRAMIFFDGASEVRQTAKPAKLKKTYEESNTLKIISMICHKKLLLNNNERAII